MIVIVTLPAGKTRANFGQAQMLADNAGKLDVPDYVAKLLVSGAGCTCPSDLSASVGSMLNALTDPDDKFAANYMFNAYGRPLPDIDSDIVAAAGALLAERGNPAVSVI